MYNGERLVHIAAATLVLYSCIFTAGSITLQTKLGAIEGIQVNISNDGTIIHFRKIPYAKPPVGNLRFRKPEPYGAWNSTLNAREYGPTCLQSPDTGYMSEDCLHLNVFIPRRIMPQTPRPVMIWIHGGGYTLESGPQYDGSRLALNGDVIFVSLNYRLGTLGFFSTGDDASRGNYGLWDQHLAIRWVHNNIADYGGDPNTVTIFGESAGGGSVTYQSMYPGNKNLFQRAISQSGVSFAQRADQRLVQSQALQFFKDTNCTSSTLTQAVECLRRLPALSFTKVYYAALPVIDGQFVVEDPETALENQTSDVYKFFTSLDYMVGVLDGDGSVVQFFLGPDILANFNTSSDKGYPYPVLCDYLVPIIAIMQGMIPNNPSIKQAACNLYRNETSLAIQSNNVIDFLSDALFIFPALRFADFHFKRNHQKTSTYFYMMTLVNTLQSSILSEFTYPWMQRSSHAMDTIYIFNSTDYFTSNEDEAFTKTLLNYWTNFAKTGNPNGAGVPNWPQYDQRSRIQVLDYRIQTVNEIFSERYDFWMNTVRTEDVVIPTKLGKISGIERRISGAGKISIFRKIPFAKPPIGPLRFRKPEPYGAWNSTLDGTVFGPACSQKIDPNSREDCLHLNIFVPYGIKTGKSKSVMIWIHGGSYTSGSGTQYDGTRIALLGDVIFVSINYRLGYLGFLSSGDPALPSNLALWDQHLAIKWVHDNIADYGGNPDSVTIFGESAGGGSVSFQSLFTGNKGLFQRVIPQSGVATSSFLRTNITAARAAALELIRQLNCSFSDMTLIADCLRRVPVASILAYTSSIPSNPAPEVDGIFVKGIPENILENKSTEVFKFFTSLDYMVGVLDGDGSVVLPEVLTPEILQLFNISSSVGLSSDVMCQYIVTIVTQDLFSKKSALRNMACSMYKNETSMIDQGNLVVDYLTDVGFTFPAILSANHHSMYTMKNKTTYFYLMTRVNPLQSLIFPLFAYPWQQRSAHAMDIIYLFHSDAILKEMPEDFTLADNMIRYWTNFAKTSNPNGENLPVWPQYDQRKLTQVLDLNIKTTTNIYPKRQEFWLSSVYEERNTVQTKLGTIIGNRNNVPGAGPIYTYLKIPYAKPPVGNLRFRKPVTFGPWQSPLNATVFGPSCMQVSIPFVEGAPVFDKSEDCLHLNIYVPYTLNPDVPRSVMIWVHGGGYATGNAMSYDGTELALRGNVIIVTINYRLGPFGFLSTGDEASRGNYGLWDQHLAFRWVHDNIASFGGDPKSVTIFGESAGGGSVSFQSLYPGNRGLIHRVIPQSGVAFSTILRAKQEIVRKTSSTYAKNLGCTSQNSTLLIECLRNQSADSLVTNTMFAPTIDGVFVLDEAENILDNKISDVYKFYTSLDYMVGVLDGDGAVMALLLLNMSQNSSISTKDLCNTLAWYYAENDFANDSSIARGICRLYSNETSVEAQSNSAVDLLTDASFTIPGIMSADLHITGRRGAMTYMYIMSRVNPKQMALITSFAFPWTQRAVHAMDIFYLFTADSILAESLQQADDMDLAHKMQMYWTNFAKTGNPNGPGLPHWPAYDSRRHTQILDVPIKTITEPIPDRVHFWLDTVLGFSTGGATKGPTSSAVSVRRNLTLEILGAILFIASLPVSGL